MLKEGGSGWERGVRKVGMVRDAGKGERVWFSIR